MAGTAGNHSCLQLYRGAEALTEANLEQLHQLLDAVKLEIEGQPSGFDTLITAAHEYAMRYVKALADQAGLKLESEEAMGGKIRWFHLTLPISILSDYIIIAEVDFLIDKSGAKIIIDFDFVERTYTD
jgi:hypothetical protein